MNWEILFKIYWDEEVSRQKFQPARLIVSAKQLKRR